MSNAPLPPAAAVTLGGRGSPGGGVGGAVSRSASRSPARRHVPWLLLAVALLLGPFVGKPFTVDDTLFLWLGQHLAREPFDFFGFPVNWYGVPLPMHEVTKNPPLAGYLIAALGAVFGWGERILHGGFLLSAAGVVLGTYFLGRRLTARPVAAALVTLASPAFVVSATSVMSDVPMLALWCWSALAWVAGVDGRRPALLAAGALLAALAGLTKYFAIALVPLLAVYALLRLRRPGAWCAWLLLPLSLWGGYHALTSALYGRGLLLDAAAYASELRGFGGERGPLAVTALGLVFAGGCLAPALVLAPALWSRRALLAGSVAAAATAALGLTRGELLGVPLDALRCPPALFSAQVGLLLAGGLSALGLAAAELRRERSPEAWLLVLWLGGTFAFAAYFNWVNNGRSNLPMAPALGLLCARRLDRLGTGRRRLLPPLLAAAAVLAAAVGWGELRRALDVRRAAADVAARTVERGRRTYFQGHWGFQWYMEAAGAVALDFERHRLQAGDILVVPVSNNTGISLPPAGAGVVRLRHTLRYGERARVHVMARSIAAGFYASNLGILPFAFGPAEPDTYLVFEATREFGWSGFSYPGVER